MLSLLGYSMWVTHLFRYCGHNFLGWWSSCFCNSSPYLSYCNVWMFHVMNFSWTMITTRKDSLREMTQGKGPAVKNGLCCAPPLSYDPASWFSGAIRDGETLRKETTVFMLCNIKFSFCCGQRKSWQIYFCLGEIFFFLNVDLEHPVFSELFSFLGWVCLYHVCISSQELFRENNKKGKAFCHQIDLAVAR